MKNTRPIMTIVLIVIIFISCNPPSPSNTIPEMKFVEGGVGIFGSEDEDADSDEMPIREKEVKSFYISTFEVTQAQWAYIMNTHPSYFRGDERPVECVSWFEVQEYIKKLNKLTGEKFRLPTELEWEYAARGGKYQKKYKYSGSKNCSWIAWWKGNSIRTSIVGEKMPNRLGLYDMTGNVHEWCANEYDSLLYSRENMNITINDNPSCEVVFKGGDWQSKKKYLRISNRNHIAPNVRNYGIGFRLAKDVE